MYYIIVRSCVDSESIFYKCRMKSEVVFREDTILDARHTLAMLKNREVGKRIWVNPNKFIVIRRHGPHKRRLAYKIIPIEEP